VHVFGRGWSRRELEARVGDMAQLCGFRHARWDVGPGADLRVVEVYNAAGLRFTVCPDRGLDVLDLAVGEVPVAFQTGPTALHPAFGAQDEAGFRLRAHGGFLFTAGPDNVGAAAVDQGRSWMPHGVWDTWPAHAVRTRCVWRGDSAFLVVEGDLSFGRLFGERLDVTRRIVCPADETAWTVTDIVRNAGFAPAPCLLLYHFNLGYPVVDEDTELLVRSRITPRDDAAQSAVHRARRVEPPLAPDAPEQVFHHTVEAEPNGEARVRVVNRRLPLTVEFRYPLTHLPHLWQWRYLSAGAYVLGIEPSNTTVLGRAAARAHGPFPMLAPGETARYRVHVRFSHTAEPS